MAVRIRVYPQNGLGGYGGYGGYGAGAYQYQARTTQLATQLKYTQQAANMRLQYERQLWAERMKTVELEAQIRYGGAYGGYGAYPGAPVPVQGAYGYGGYSPWGGYSSALSGASLFGGLGNLLGGMRLF